MRVFPAVPAATRRRPGSGLPHLVLSGLLWGTGGVTGSLLSGTAHLPATSVAAYRLLSGGALIVAFLMVTGRHTPVGRAAWTRIALIGLLAAFYQGCYFTAVSLTSVPLATLITIGTAPVIVLAVERVTGRGRNGRLTSAASGLALIGLGLLVGLPSGFSQTRVAASAGMALLAAAGFSAITLAGSRPVPGLDDLTVTGFGFLLGGLALLPLAAADGGLGFRPGAASVGLLVALGTGPTAVAYTLYFRGLRAAAASTAAILTLLEPLTGTVLAAMLLGERLSAAGVAGAVILAIAVLLTVRAHARPSATGRAEEAEENALASAGVGDGDLIRCDPSVEPEPQPPGCGPLAPHASGLAVVSFVRAGPTVSRARPGHRLSDGARRPRSNR